MKAFIILCFVAVASAQWGRPGGRWDGNERPRVQEPRCGPVGPQGTYTTLLNDPNNQANYLECTEQGWAAPHTCNAGLVFNGDIVNPDGTRGTCVWPATNGLNNQFVPPQFPALRPFAEDAPSEEVE